MKVSCDLLARLNEARSATQALDAALDMVLSIRPCPFGAAYSHHPGRRHFECVATRGRPASIRRRNVDLPAPLAEPSRFKKGAPLYLSSTRDAALGGWLKERGCSSLLALPLAHAGRVHGLLLLATARGAVLSRPTRRALEKAARCAGRIIHSLALARSLQQLQARQRNNAHWETPDSQLAHERRLLAQSLLEVQERERKNISDFLHDHMGPLLIMAKIDLEELGRSVPEASRALVGQITRRLDDVLSGIRHKALAVRPPLLDDLDVKEALEFLVEEFSQHHHLPVALAQVPRVPALSPSVKTCLYRVLQEALLNVAMHAGASSVSVVVEHLKHQLRMQIRDNGVGFDPREVSPRDRLGLIGMREIVHSLDGSLRLSTRPGHGTLVEVTVPIIEEKR